MSTIEVEIPESLTKLVRDVKSAAATMNEQQARYIVDMYYALQKFRIRAASQTRAAGENGEPHRCVEWVGSQMLLLEKSMASVLDSYGKQHRFGQWSRGIYGIGPVIAAGLIAHIDMTRCRYPGQLWSFAGQNPTAVWSKGMKRPWNASLKVVCWKAGQSFLKLSRRQEGERRSWYGLMYRLRKASEQARNATGGYKDEAARALAGKKFRESDTKKVYESGMLPPGHIDARARRWAVKMFLSHWHEFAFEVHYGEPSPTPYVLQLQPHGHRITLDHVAAWESGTMTDGELCRIIPTSITNIDVAAVLAEARAAKEEEEGVL